MAKCMHWLIIAVSLIYGLALHPVTALAQGQAIYNDKCAMCHGKDGKGNTPAGSAFIPPPADFNSPGFWQGDVKQKIAKTIENGHGPMPAFTELGPSQIKEVINYMEQSFKH